MFTCQKLHPSALTGPGRIPTYSNRVEICGKLSLSQGMLPLAAIIYISFGSGAQGSLPLVRRCAAYASLVEYVILRRRAAAKGVAAAAQAGGAGGTVLQELPEFMLPFVIQVWRCCSGMLPFVNLLFTCCAHMHILSCPPRLLRTLCRVSHGSTSIFHFGNHRFKRIQRALL